MTAPRDDERHVDPPAGLPGVPGGWTARQVDVGARRFHLTLPADPDEFLGDEETIAARPGDDYVPYWPHLWPAATQMAELILAGDWTSRAATLEAGCGVGLVGLAGLAAGLDVTFSDYEPAAVQLACHNAAANGFNWSKSLVLDWRQPLPRRFAVILACEVLYEVRHHAPLLNLLEAMLDSEGCCWIGDGGRQVTAGFIEQARRRGFDVQLRDEQGRPMPAPHVGRFQLLILRRQP